MELTIVQSLLLALYYWVSKFGVIYSLSAIYAGPLVASLISGIILGDIPTAMKIGAAIQPMFLAFVGAGGTVVWDETAAAIFGCTRHDDRWIGCVPCRYHCSACQPLMCTVAYHSPYCNGIPCSSAPTNTRKPAILRESCSWLSGYRKSLSSLFLLFRCSLLCILAPKPSALL